MQCAWGTTIFPNNPMPLVERTGDVLEKMAEKAILVLVWECKHREPSLLVRVLLDDTREWMAVYDDTMEIRSRIDQLTVPIIHYDARIGKFTKPQPVGGHSKPMLPWDFGEEVSDTNDAAETRTVAEDTHAAGLCPVHPDDYEAVSPPRVGTLLGHAYDIRHGEGLRIRRVHRGDER